MDKRTAGVLVGTLAIINRILIQFARGAREVSQTRAVFEPAAEKLAVSTRHLYGETAVEIGFEDGRIERVFFPARYQAEQFIMLVPGLDEYKDAQWAMLSPVQEQKYKTPEVYLQ